MKNTILKDGSIAIVRSPEKSDAKAMIAYLKLTAEQTHFMIRYPEEIEITLAEEKEQLQRMIESKTDMMISVFVADELAGNAALRCMRDHIKLKHRVSFGIAIKKEYWNRESLNQRMYC